MSRACLCALLSICMASVARGDSPLTFEQHVRPILKVHCFHCHGDNEEHEGSLDVRLRRLLEEGGDSGSALVPGKPGESLLLTRIRAGEMPPGDKKVPEAEIAVLEKWIASGAITAAPEPADPKLLGEVTEADRNFWSFQPIAQPSVPAVADNTSANPIDAFLLEKLRENSLGFATAADKRTLIRRATFDLLGLPPTPAEVEAFVADGAEDAYERLIDRLLASPHYGERWGRHWLDVAGYADSDGYTIDDPPRKFAYKYRDYVIRSLNDDKPWNDFIVEQLAGDELVAQPYQNLSPQQQDLLAATGFLRMVPDGSTSPGTNPTEVRNAVINETVKVVSTALLGMSVGCAQCHSHKYDPIPQADFYRMRALLEPALDWKNWRDPSQRMVSLYTDEQRQKAAELEAEAAKVEAERAKRAEELVKIYLDKELAKIPEARRADVLKVRETPEGQRTPEQQAIAKEFFSAINLNAGTLELYDGATLEELGKFTKRATEIRASKPPEEFLAILNEPASAPAPQTFLFMRGDPEQPKGPVLPGELAVLANYVETQVPEDDPSIPSSGRRLAYARHLTSGRHPLVARVLVNRFWMHHFGRGLVSTPADFGRLGEAPTHPALLDWLASDFMASGWKLKRLHKLIMTSQAYRQSSERRPEVEALDPDNKLLARMSVRRLEAEALRDAMLSVSGKLNAKTFGPPVPVAEDEFGQIVPGIEFTDGNGVAQPNRNLGGEEFRRSVYLQVRRSKPLSMLDAFDLPIMEPNCDLRNSSTVTPQSLLLMNSDFIRTTADHLATRLEQEAGADAGARLTLAWQLAFGRAISLQELQQTQQFLTQQIERVRSSETATAAATTPDAAAAESKIQHTALANLCQALMSSNEFLYVD